MTLKKTLPNRGPGGRPRTDLDPEVAGPFGTFVWKAIEAYEQDTGREIKLEHLAEYAGMDYSNLHRVIRGKPGRQPIRPEIPTVKKIFEALDEMGIPIDVEEGYKIANMLPEGFRIVPEDSELVAVTDKTREIAERLRDRREHLKRHGHPELTQQYMADKLGMDQSNYNKVEAGTVPLTAAKLQVAAEILEVPVGYLYGELSEEQIEKHELVQWFEGLPPPARELVRNMTRSNIEQVKKMFAEWESEDDKGTYGSKA
jgi:transcriptional regulator with XRE-family HTH domain